MNKIPGGYGIIQKNVMKHKMSIQAKSLYALLASYTGQKDYCFPSIKQICEDLNLSKTMVIKYLKELEENKLLKKSKLYNNDLRNNNKYELYFLEEKNNILPITVKPVNSPRSNRVNLQGLIDDTCKVESTKPARSNRVNLQGLTDDTCNNNSINNNSINNNNNADIKSAKKKPSNFTELKSMYNQFLLDNDYIQEIINDTIYKTSPGKSGNKELRHMRELFDKFDSLDKFKVFLKKVKEFEWLNDKPLLPSMLNGMYEKIMFHRPNKTPPKEDKPLWVQKKEEKETEKEILRFREEQRLLREAEAELKRLGKE